MASAAGRRASSIAAAVHHDIVAAARSLTRQLGRLAAVQLVTHTDIPAMRLKNLQWLCKIDSAVSGARIGDETGAHYAIRHR